MHRTTDITAHTAIKIPRFKPAPAFLAAFLLSGWAGVFLTNQGDYVQYFTILATIIFSAFSLSSRFVHRFIKSWPALAMIFILGQVPFLFYHLSVNAKEVKFYVIILFCAYSAGILTKNSAALTFIKTYAYLCLILSIGALLVGRSVMTADDNRLLQGEGNPIWIARASGAAILYFSFFLLTQSKRAFAVMALIPCAVAMVLAGSRGPIGALLVSILAMMLITKGRRIFISKKVIISAVIFIFMGAGAVILAPDSIRLRLIGIFIGSYNGSDDLRAQLYLISFKLLEKTVWGLGFGAFEATGAPQPYPHNLLLECLIEPGLIFTIVLFVTVFIGLFKLFRIARRTWNSSPVYVYLACLAIFAFCNAMFSGDITSPKELYVCSFLGIMLGKMDYSDFLSSE